MTKSTKRWALLFLGFAIVAMLLLSVSLPSLKFQPGQPFSLGNSQPPPGATSGLEMPSDLILILIRGLLALMLLILPIYIILHLLTPEGRRKLLGDLVVILLFFAAAEFLSRLPREAPISQQQSPGEQGGLTLPTPAGPIATFTAQSTPALEIIVIVAIALIIAIGIGALYWYYRQRQEQNLEATPLEQLANEAQQAVDALMAGEDIKDIVIRSYIQMSRVLWQERDIKRDEVMTPHEFEQSLVKKGIPYEPVHQLTRLFEEVRYGTKQPGHSDELRAIDSLTTIVEFCREPETPE